MSSARAFLSGLKDQDSKLSSFEADVDHEDYQGELQSIDYLDTEIEINSKLLRFYDYCRKYVEWVDDHPRSINEFNKFANGGHISNIRKKIQAKYGLQHLTNKQVVIIRQGFKILKILLKDCRSVPTDDIRKCAFWQLGYEQNVRYD